MASHRSDTAAAAGRGTVYITLAKLYFIATGFLIEFLLPRLLSKEQYGAYGTAVSVVSILNAVIVTGTQQAVAKFVSERPESADRLRDRILGIQAALAVLVTGGYVAAAPAIAGGFFNDARLVWPLRVSAVITFCYAFYAVYVGYLNGRREFFRQAALDASYSTFKVVGILACAAALHSVVGAVGGFALGAFLVLALAPFVARGSGQDAEPHVGIRGFLAFQAPLLIFILSNNLLQKVDTLFLKAYSSPDPLVANENVGEYRAIVNLANITYQAIVSVTFVAFPLISKASFENSLADVRTYIRQTLRAVLIVMGILATLFSSNAADVLRLVYPKSYETGAPALQLIAYGMLGFGLLTVVTTIVTGSGRPRVSLLIGLVTLAASAALNYGLIPLYGLRGAAIGTTTAMAVGSVIACGYVRARFGALVGPLTVVRVVAAAGIAYVLAVIPWHGVFVVPKMAVQGIAYLAVLVALGELGMAEARLVHRMVTRR